VASKTGKETASKMELITLFVILSPSCNITSPIVPIADGTFCGNANSLLVRYLTLIILMFGWQESVPYTFKRGD
jgi:hypothetical protein